MTIDKKIRILFLSNMTKFSGGEIVLFRIVSNNDFLIPTFVLPEGDFSNLLEQNALPVVQLNTLVAQKHQKSRSVLLTFLKNFKEIRNVVKKNNTDLIVANGSGLGLYSGLVHIFLRKKTVVIHHHPHLSKSSRTRFLLFHISVLINSKTVAVSDAIKHSFLSWSVFQRKIMRIYNGIHLSAFSERSENTPVIPIESGVKNLGMIATIVEWKGQLLALQAVHHLVKSGTTNIKLYFVGEILNETPAEYEYLELLHQYIKSNRLENYIVFTGKIRGLYSIYANLDIVLNCSIEPEPFGTTIYEAMGFGKIVIASNLGGTPEMIYDGVNGYLYSYDQPIELANKIKTVLNRSDNQISRNAQEFVFNHLNIERTQLDYNTLFQSLTAESQK